jgi:hypothetical protein
MPAESQSFLKRAGRILNAGQSRALLLTGNVYDLFRNEKGSVTDYDPLLDYLTDQWDLNEFLLVTYELNGPIRFVRRGDAEKVRDAWLRWKVGMDSNEIDVQRMLDHEKVDPLVEEARTVYDESLRKTLNNPGLALEFLRQACLCARTEFAGERNLKEKLLVLVESADLIIPETEISRLSDNDRQRIGICHDWFSDPGFLNGDDSVVMIAESASQLHHRIARLPQVLEVEVAAPDMEARKAFIGWFKGSSGGDQGLDHWGSETGLAKITAGLSIHALMQLLKGARHERRRLEPDEVIGKVEDFIKSQLGEETVEFKKPTHSLDDVVGFSRLKNFLRTELIPRFQLDGAEALPGAAVSGPIGGGKTFIFEAVSAELDMVVLVIKNVRSKWFGETDMIFERLRRVLNTLSKVLIFIDEADTQLGGVGAGTHDTERRLTGKIQGMMSDPALRGRVFWLLATARIHLLSPDIRRPGRVGDLIIPVLDPEGTDRKEFIQWMLEPVSSGTPTGVVIDEIDGLTGGFSAATFASLRSELKAAARLSGKQVLSATEITRVIGDHLTPTIADTRRYQTLQALLNCTRRSLLPNPGVTDGEMAKWAAELRSLEARGVS